MEGEERQKRGRFRRFFFWIFGSSITITLDEVKERQVAVDHEREESLKGILYDGQCHYSLLYTPVVRIRGERLLQTNTLIGQDIQLSNSCPIRV